MNYEEGKRVILKHALIAEPDASAPPGLLGSLRPFKGVNEAHFRELMSALRAVAPRLRTDSRLDRDLLSALWAIVDLGRAWSAIPNGMLITNQLIGPDETRRLHSYLDAISYAVMTLLDGGDETEAFAPSEQVP